MTSFREDVAEDYLSGGPHASLRELCRDWKRVRTPYSVTHAISNAADDGRGRELYETLLDEDFRALRQEVSGINGLREDVRTGLDYFTGRQPDLLKYIRVRFLEPAAPDQDFLAAHQQHCQGFSDFLQLDLLPHERRLVGLHKELQRFFPVHPKPYWPPLDGERPVIDLVGYDLGMWRCSCGALTGLDARYSYNCPCGTVRGTGRMAHDMTVCATCGALPAYTPCPTCGTRVTLENLWKISEDYAPPSVYQIPLILQLLIRHTGREVESTRLPLMLMPIPLGIQEQGGSIVIGLPDVLWFDDFSSTPTRAQFASLNDALRYDRQAELRKIFESMFRRTLLNPRSHGESGSYREWGKYITGLLAKRDSMPDHSLTRGFQERIRKRLAGSGTDEDMLRFVELSADCIVAASPVLRENSALVSSDFAKSPLLSVPHLVKVRTGMEYGVSLTADLSNTDAHRTALLDTSGLARPGQIAEPGQALAGLTRPVMPNEPLTPEEKILRAIFGEKPSVRDVSLLMPGGRAGRVLEQHITIDSLSAETIPSAPGRFVQRGGPASIIMTIAVDRPLEAGDALLDGTGSGATAVVCGIYGTSALSQITNTSHASDLIVGPDHPWAPPAGTHTRRIRVRLSKDAPAANDMTYRSIGNYSLLDQPPVKSEPGDAAVLLTPREFGWLIGKQARHLALELYGPRGDARTWRDKFHDSLDSNQAISIPAGTPIAEWASLSDSPSTAILRWEMILRGARIRSHISHGLVVFHLMTDSEVLELSHGEVTQLDDSPSEEPSPAGLFSERIFGPKHNLEARRQRMGHIQLPTPVIHSWFLRGAQRRRLADLLRMSAEELTQITKCARYVVADPGDTSLRRGQILLTRDEHTSRYRQTRGVRLAVGGEAVEILLRQANRTHGPDLTADQVIIRKIPVLPPALRPDTYTNRGQVSSHQNLHYRRLLQSTTERWPELAMKDSFTNEDTYLRWHAGLQSEVNMLLGFVPLLPDHGTSDDADRPVSVRDYFLNRSVDFSASARLTTGSIGEIGTALLPEKVMWKLLQPTIARILVRTGAASHPWDAQGLARKQSKEARGALIEASLQALVLLSLPTGPWPLVAMRIQPAVDNTVHIHPDLLDQVGWENLGQTVKIFGILTESAALEAERLLTPSHLLDAADVHPQDQHPRNSIFDLTPENLIDSLTQAAWDKTPFHLRKEDGLLLCAADWA